MNIAKYAYKKLRNTVKRNLLCRSKGIILMYHRVIDLSCDPWQICVSVKNFQEQMKILKKYGTPVQMREMASTLASYSIGNKQIVVTFDDGYADNFNNAKPILERYKIPATFFIVTGMLDKKEEYWWDKLEKILLHPTKLPNEFKMTIGQKNYHWLINPQDSKESMAYVYNAPIPSNGELITRGQLYFVLWEILSHLSFADKKEILSKIAHWSNHNSAPRESHRTMTTEELLKLSRVSLFEIGAHTRQHPILSYLNKEEQENEIKQSKQEIESIVGKTIQSFSYPHGAYTAETTKIVKDLKFSASCTVAARQVTRLDDPLFLPRFAVLNWNGKIFEEKLREWLEVI